MPTTVIAEKKIKGTPAQVYYAFTNAAALNSWLCDFATVAPRPGGRMYLWWHGDFYSAGEFIDLRESKSIKFKWFGRSEPAPSEIDIALFEGNGGTLVRLVHTVPDGEDWKQRAAVFKSEWDSALENLSQVIETGMDKRTFDRPMLGINISDFNPEIAKTMKVPVIEGLRLDEVNEGMGAYAAGLRKNDILVELNGHPIKNDFGSVVVALQGKKGGDKVDVTFYRGPEKNNVIMELTKRPVPDIPWDPTILANRVREKYGAALTRLETCFKDISEDQAGFEPAPGEWSAKQVLAHLILSERFLTSDLDDLVGGFPRISDEWGGNLPAHINAVVAAHATIRTMLDELHRLSMETVAFLAALPAAFVERKASYYAIVMQALEIDSHILSHMDQIKAAIAAARKS